MKSNLSIGIVSKVVEHLYASFQCPCGSYCLIGGNGAEGHEYSHIDSSCIIQNAANYLLHLFDTYFIQFWWRVWMEWSLGLWTKLLRGRRVRAILDPFACNVTVLLQFLLNVPRHGNFNHAVGIIPIEANASIQITCPVVGKSMCCLDWCNQMVYIILIHVFDPKIINHQSKRNRLSLVIP